MKLSGGTGPFPGADGGLAWVCREGVQTVVLGCGVGGC